MLPQRKLEKQFTVSIGVSHTRKSLEKGERFIRDWVKDLSWMCTTRNNYHQSRLLEISAELKLSLNVWSLLSGTIPSYKMSTQVLQKPATDPKLLSWDLQVAWNNLAKPIPCQQESNATCNWFWLQTIKKSCKRTPPACLYQIGDLASQREVAARCFDHKKN